MGLENRIVVTPIRRLSCHQHRLQYFFFIFTNIFLLNCYYISELFCEGLCLFCVGMYFFLIDHQDNLEKNLHLSRYCNNK